MRNITIILNLIHNIFNLRDTEVVFSHSIKENRCPQPLSKNEIVYKANIKSKYNYPYYL